MAINVQDIRSSDIDHSVKIGEGIWWVGAHLPDDPFQCHAYLIENGRESVLIDPGGYLTFDTVRQKVEEIIPFGHIRYFICQHQDPDIAASLKIIDTLPDRHEAATVVTHWRAQHLLKHYDLTMPFLDVEHISWEMNLGEHLLKFIFTPYLHFPGAFCTLDTNSGILFSSDLFGGFTSGPSLVADSESYIEEIRPFHEHYMPSHEVLLHGLMRIENNSISMIAPQHGRIIPENLVHFIIERLKQLDCGIYTLADDDTDVRRLSELNKALRDITHAVIMYRDFRNMVGALQDIFRRVLPVQSIGFFTDANKKGTLFLTEKDRFHGTFDPAPQRFSYIFTMDRTAWHEQHHDCFAKICITKEDDESKYFHEGLAFLMPFFPHIGGNAHAGAIISLEEDVRITSEIRQILEQMSNSLSAAIEREKIYRMLDLEHQCFYEQSIHDPLTGLYNRLYLEETIKRLMQLHDRNEQLKITVALFDLDHFKEINDNYGHLVGDRVLKKVGAVFLETIRAGDLPVRIGGEEFAVFLTGHSLESCRLMAEKIRKKVASLILDTTDDGREVMLTISAGVTERKANESYDDLIKRADSALYKAKHNGRDAVISLTADT